MTYERQFFQYLENLKRRIYAQPLNLGGVSSSGGGVGGPPGGFLGKLPQSKVTFDKLEEGRSGTVASGASLLDNLNHIRRRLTNVEASGAFASSFQLQEDDVVIASGVQTINFEGNVSLVDEGSKKVTVTVSGGGISGISILEDDLPIATGVTTINFEGDVTTVDEGGDTVTVTISGGGGGTADGSFWSTDAAPTSPSVYDDEFDDESFNTSLWTEFDIPTGLGQTENAYGLEFTGHSTGHVLQGIYQVVPSGAGFTIATKVSWLAGQLNDCKAGLIVLDDSENLSTSDLGVHFHYRGSAGAGVQSEYYTAYDTFDTAYDNLVSDKWATTMYLRMVCTETEWYFGWSLDGIGWMDRVIQARPFAPDAVGLCLKMNTTDNLPIFHWFRYFPTATHKTIIEGNRINYYNA